MALTPASGAAAPASSRADWVMLLALTGGFTLSTAWRTIAAIMAPALQQEFALSAQQLGLFAGIFHFAFGALQLLMGVGIDVHGLRRTVLAAFPLTFAGAALSALTHDFSLLLLGQALIGIGCAPAFLVCSVFIARRFPPERFASVSGIVLALGGVGMLMTGTPLAWVIEASSWRGGFVALGALSVLAWLTIWWLVREAGAGAHEPAGASPEVRRETLADALRGFVALFAVPHTWGIVALGAVTYAAFVTLRGLWLGPMLIERYDLSLVQAGNVAIVVSIASMVAMPLWGRFDPGAATRRRRLVQFTLGCALLFVLLAPGAGATVDIGLSIAYSLLTGYIVYQYADVRAAYPASMIGRALALFTMAMFLGVALMQWATGAMASAASGWHVPTYAVVMGTIAALLAAGALAFAWLPQPGRQRAER
ncbi:MAG: MFS transporter [Burkholderiaceae bacterium]|nr:MFS transporter [Burkholderiaceae bacterium]